MRPRRSVRPPRGGAAGVGPVGRRPRPSAGPAAARPGSGVRARRRRPRSGPARLPFGIDDRPAGAAEARGAGHLACGDLAGGLGGLARAAAPAPASGRCASSPASPGSGAAVGSRGAWPRATPARRRRRRPPSGRRRRRPRARGPSARPRARRPGRRRGLGGAANAAFFASRSEPVLALGRCQRWGRRQRQHRLLCLPPPPPKKPPPPPSVRRRPALSPRRPRGWWYSLVVNLQGTPSGVYLCVPFRGTGGRPVWGGTPRPVLGACPPVPFRGAAPSETRLV